MKTLFEHVFNLEPTQENIDRIKKFQDKFCDGYYDEYHYCSCFGEFMREELDEYCDYIDFICAGRSCDECPFQVGNASIEWIIDYFKDNNNNFITVRRNILTENK
jgi:ribosome modulation factor